MSIKTFFQAPDRLRTDLTMEDVVDAVHATEHRIWVDVMLDDEAEWLELGQSLGLHPLTLEDTLNPQSRVKVEEFDSYLFIVVRDAKFALDTPEPYDFETYNLCLYVGEHFLISVHAHPSDAIDEVAKHVAVGPELMDRGVDYLAYQILDSLIDSYFPLLDRIDEFVDELETGVFGKSDSQEVLTSIFELKRTLLALRRHQAPMREVMTTLANRPTAYLSTPTQVYMRDVYDHVVRQVESIETYRDLLSGALEIHFTVVSNRLNEIMKALSIIATVILPATWVASIYGMNFESMPWLHSRYGFWIAMAIMAGVSVLLLMYLRRKRMI